MSVLSPDMFMYEAVYEVFTLCMGCRNGPLGAYNLPCGSDHVVYRIWTRWNLARAKNGGLIMYVNVFICPEAPFNGSMIWRCPFPLI